MFNLYRLRVTLIDSPVIISRDIEIPAATSLSKLHLILQTVMGWQNAHLYQFERGTECWTNPYTMLLNDDFDDELDQKEDTHIPLNSLLSDVGQKLLYRYDFGDDWLHEITLIDQDNGEFNTAMQVCLLDAEGACPPEDVGGTHGYLRMLTTLDSGDQEEIEHYLGWLGRDNWDPDGIESTLLAERIAALNLQLAQIYRASHLTWQLKPNELVSTSPIIQLLRPMLDILSAQPLKLTNKGNLPLRLVQAMYGIEQNLPSWQKRRLKRTKITTEQESAMICFSREIAQKAGLIKVTANKLQLTKIGEKVVLARDEFTLYNKLLKAAVDKFNWCNLDNFPEYAYYQAGFMSMLDTLLLANGELSSDELIVRLQLCFPELDTEHYADYQEDTFNHRIGFMGELFELCTVTEQELNEEFPYRRSFSVQATELAEQLLDFDTECSR